MAVKDATRPIAESSKAELVPFDALLKLVESRDPMNLGDLDTYPSLKIMDFYRAMSAQEADIDVSVERTSSASETMGTMPSISADHVMGWTKTWNP